MHFTSNPFTWSPNAKDVRTPVSQIDLRRGDTTESVVDLSDPINIELSHSEEFVTATDVEMKENYTTYVDFEKTSNASKILVPIQPNICKHISSQQIWGIRIVHNQKRGFGFLTIQIYSSMSNSGRR